MSDFVTKEDKVFVVENGRYPYIQVGKILDKELYHPIWVDKSGLYKIFVCEKCFIQSGARCQCSLPTTTFKFVTENECLDWLKSKGVDVNNPIWIIPQGTILKDGSAIQLPARIVS